MPVERYQEIEKTIVKDGRRNLWGRFIKAMERYELIEEGDRIAVCVSGGKDSALLAKLLQLYQRYGIKKIELEFISMDPGYDEKNRNKLSENARLLGIPLKVFGADVFEAARSAGTSPCFICSRMRRGHLYRQAKEAGCNKIALGHHYDDVIETILMGMLYGAQIQTMLPKRKSDNVAGMELIRPMYLIREQNIVEWAACNGLDFMRCSCRNIHKGEGADTQENFQNTGESGSFLKRAQIKRLIAELREDNPLVESNIFGSVENVNLRKIMGYQKDGVKRTFMDDYGE